MRRTDGAGPIEHERELARPLADLRLRDRHTRPSAYRTREHFVQRLVENDMLDRGPTRRGHDELLRERGGERPEARGSHQVEKHPLAVGVRLIVCRLHALRSKQRLLQAEGRRMLALKSHWIVEELRGFLTRHENRLAQHEPRLNHV